MPESIERLFAFAREAARANDWKAFRGRFDALCRALEADDLSPALVQSLDTLSAANCALDPDGCRAELERVGEMLASHTLDLRDLEPPEPMMRIMERLARAPGEPLRVRLRHEPVPLYELLAQRGFAWRGAPLSDGGYELIIERSASS